MTIIWSDPVTIANRIEYPGLWTAPAIGLWIEGTTLPVWRKVGYSIEPLIDGEFFNSQIKSVEFGKSLIQIPYRTYRLSFEPLENLISIYSSLSIKITSIRSETMGINYQNTDKVTGGIIDTLFAPLITSAQALAADTLRTSGTVYNRTNRIIYVSWGAAAATAANLAVPAGANVDIPENFTGAIQIIRAAGGSMGCIVLPDDEFTDFCKVFNRETVGHEKIKLWVQYDF